MGVRPTLTLADFSRGANLIPQLEVGGAPPRHSVKENWECSDCARPFAAVPFFLCFELFLNYLLKCVFFFPRFFCFCAAIHACMDEWNFSPGVFLSPHLAFQVSLALASTSDSGDVTRAKTGHVTEELRQELEVCEWCWQRKGACQLWEPGEFWLWRTLIWGCFCCMRVPRRPTTLPITFVWLSRTIPHDPS